MFSKNSLYSNDFLQPGTSELLVKEGIDLLMQKDTGPRSVIAMAGLCRLILGILRQKGR